MADFEFTTVTSKGQVVVPKAIRVKAGIGVNDKLACFFSEGFVVLRKVETPDFKSEFEGAFSKKEGAFDSSAEEFSSDILAGVKKLHKASH
ncbi:MAG: AbrB/MazE/SpoVT family DNA-binding domain-containing protein [Candidatus Micrarchaeia archaeon]